MDGTAEGIRQAASTREALRKRRRDDAEAGGEEGGAGAADAAAETAAPAAAPAPHRSEPTCTHEVAIPDGYDPSSSGLDPNVYGEVL